MDGSIAPIANRLSGRRLAEKVRILKSDHAGRPRKSFAAVPPEPDEIRMVPIPKVFEVNPEKFGELSRLYMKWLSCWNALHPPSPFWDRAGHLFGVGGSGQGVVFPKSFIG